MSKEAMKLALEALGNSWTEPGNKQYEFEKEAITALREALAEQEPGRNHYEDGDVFERIAAMKEQPAQQAPVALKWQQAPVKTQWGDEMVVASVAIDKDHTVCLYCERDQTPKVEAMFAQRPWVGLTHEEAEEVWKRVEASDFRDCVHPFAQAIEAALRSKNT